MNELESKLTQSKYYSSFPGEFNRYDVVKAQCFYDDLSLEEYNDQIRHNTKNYSYNNQLFRMVVNRPDDNDRDSAVITIGEFATPIVPHFLVKSEVIRNAVNPRATLIAMPTSAIDQENMNYSNSERKALSNGDYSPVVGRISKTLEKNGNPSDITIFGASQGATFGLAYAAHPDTQATAVAAAEIPNIVDRSSMQLARDFLDSGKDLKDIVRSNFDNESQMSERIISNTGIIGLGKFAIRALCLDNLASIKSLRYNSASSDIDTILKKGGSVVHAFGDQDNVSPLLENIAMADYFEKYPKYLSLVLRGLGHAATDLYALDGALARKAHKLRYN